MQVEVGGHIVMSKSGVECLEVIIEAKLSFNIWLPFIS